jgi:cytochrome b561
VAQSLHWLIVLLVLLQFCVGPYAADLPLGIERLKMLTFHKSLGITVFALVILRVLWRLYTPAPKLPEGMKPLERLLAHASHVALYGLLLTLPVLGWLTSNASNLTVRWFYLFNLPNLTAPDRDFAKLTKELHDAGAWCLLALVCLHVAAAFWHEFARHDGVLRRMLPLWISPKEQR